MIRCCACEGAERRKIFTNFARIKVSCFLVVAANHQNIQNHKMIPLNRGLASEPFRTTKRASCWNNTNYLWRCWKMSCATKLAPFGECTWKHYNMTTDSIQCFFEPRIAQWRHFGFRSSHMWAKIRSRCVPNTISIRSRYLLDTF